MVTRKQLLAFEFYKKSPFMGSDTGMRYRVEKTTIGEGDDAKDMLLATVWPEPFSFDNTDDDKKTTHLAEFSEDGLCDCVDWINSMHDNIT